MGEGSLSLRPWAIPWNRSAGFQRSQIRRLSCEPIRHVRQDRASIDGRRSGLESEIKVFRLVELLQAGDILGVEPADIHKNVVIDKDAVPVLSRRLTVLRESREFARLEIGSSSRAQGIDCNA